MEKEIYPFDPEWHDLILKIMEYGGSLWVLERTDTHQFMIRDWPLKDNVEHIPIPTFLQPIEWKDVFPELSHGEYGNFMMFNPEDLYPTKELAEKFAPKELREGGCEYCGHGSKKIPIRLTEHEFINSPH